MGRTTKQEKYGLRNIRTVVEAGMQSDWLEFPSQSDDGIDGVITFRKRDGEPSGEIVFVQSKCLSKYQKAPGGNSEHIGINLGKKYIKDHIPRWKVMIAPVIIVYTQFFEDDSKAISWWTDAKGEESYSSNEVSYVIIPEKQKFNAKSINELKKLCGYRHKDYRLPTINLDRKDVNYIPLGSHVREAAKNFYNDWKKSDLSERENRRLGEIQISRVGWRHITRKGRKPERILQSWQLLGVAKRIILEVDEPEIVSHAKKTVREGFEVNECYVVLRAFVAFPHRYESSVSVVLKKKEEINTITGEVITTVWFYSVYETRRGRTLSRMARNRKE